MTIKTTILDFQLCNTFEHYQSHMNVKEEQTMFKEIGVNTSYFGKLLEDLQRATIIFQGPVNALYNNFMSLETTPIVEASVHIY